MNLKIKIQERIEKDVDDQLYRIYRNLYWIYPTRFKEHYQHFESFNFVKQMWKDNQLLVKKTKHLTLIYNPYVRPNVVIHEYWRTHEEFLTN